MRRWLVGLLALVNACDRRAAPNPSAAELVPFNAQQPNRLGAPEKVPAPRSLSVDRGDCVTGGQTSLRGVLGREIAYGAPGYGETPKLDRRDTVVVLLLAAPLAVCQEDAPLRDRRVALRSGLLGIPREALAAIGARVTVYGELGPSSFGFEHGPLVLWVDSIPALRPPPITHSARS